jgi:hypothetical protein
MKNTLLIPVFISAALPFSCSAQTYRDAGLWTTVSLEYEVTRKLTFVADEEFRLRNNFTEVNLFYTNLGITYSPNRSFKFGLTYRNIQKFRLDGFVSFRNRIMLDFIVKHKINPWTFSMRTRVQGEFQDYYTSEYGKIPEFYLRNKFEIKYDLDRWTPYASIEFRYQIYERKTPETDGLYHRARPAAGVDFKINKHHSCGVYYLVQKEWNVSEVDELFIAGVQYTVKLESL